MLHIATPFYRPQYLEAIYESIPKYHDITWHIAKTKNSPSLKYDFLKDPRIKVYEIDCSDKDTVTKRNTIFNHIKEGFFFLLDDDTIFVEEAYNVYKQYSEEGFVGMIVGNQLLILQIMPLYDFICSVF